MKARHPFCQLSRSKRLLQERCPLCIRQGRPRTRLKTNPLSSLLNSEIFWFRGSLLDILFGSWQFTILDSFLPYLPHLLTFYYVTGFYVRFISMFGAAIRLTSLRYEGILFIARFSASAVRI